MTNAPNILRTAVVGVGPMGMHHVRAAADIANTKLVAVVDVDRARADEVAQQFGCKALYSAADLVGLIDVATIATPPEFHAAAAAPLLKAGIGCLIEKPLAMSEADCNAILQAAGATPVAVGHIERFNPATEALFAIGLKSSDITAIDVERLSPASGRQVPVDVVSDMMIHDLDIVLALKPADIVSASGYGQMQSHAKSVLRFSDGGVATLVANRSSDQRKRVMKVETMAQVYTLDFMARTLTRTDKASSETHSVSVTEHDALRAEIADFCNAVRNKRAPRVTPGHALSSLRAAWAILDAMRGCQA